MCLICVIIPCALPPHPPLRLLLIQEKEQLLRELRGVKSSGRSAQEMDNVGERIAQLERDLTYAMQLSNCQIAERWVAGFISRAIDRIT